MYERLKSRTYAFFDCLAAITGFIRSGKVRKCQDFRVPMSGKTGFLKKSGKSQENGVRVRKKSGFFDILNLYFFFEAII